MRGKAAAVDEADMSPLRRMKEHVARVLAAGDALSVRDLAVDGSDLMRELGLPPGKGIGVLLGEPSGWLVDVDLDCPEAREAAERFLPPTACVTGRESSKASHRWYVADGARTRQFRDPVDRSMIVELRSTGAQTIVGPSIHPSGERYDALNGIPATIQDIFHIWWHGGCF